MTRSKWIVAACAALALAGCKQADGAEVSAPPTAGVTDAMIAQADGDEWLTYGRDYGEQRFSPLTQITAENVGDLGLAWYADLDTARGQEATPLVHGGVLYISTAWSKVLAFDAKTGQQKWSYDPEVPRETLAVACCDAVNRGVALYGDKVYVATLDGFLVALNQSDGSVAWRKEVVPDHKNYTITGAPRVARGKVFIGWGGVWDIAPGILSSVNGRPRNVSRLLVFKLGADGKLPPAPPLNERVLDPPAFTGTEAQVARGADLYGRYCSVCHGDAAVAGALNPDLRHSGTISSADAIRAIVVDGALKHNGMVSFASAVTPADAEAIRHYLIKRANEDKALETRRGT